MRGFFKWAFSDDASFTVQFTTTVLIICAIFFWLFLSIALESGAMFLAPFFGAGLLLWIEYQNSKGGDK